jgi:hypothetical protein
MTKPNIFASEFGCIGMSSFESMSPLLKPEHWGLHAGVAPDNCTQSWDRACHGDNPMSLRNYPWCAWRYHSMYSCLFWNIYATATSGLHR